MFRRMFILIVACIASSFLYADSIQYYEIIAKNGDGVHSLLRRYELNDYKCNISKFYELNEMNEGSILLADRKYRIPIYVYDYNGVSIRSTLGISDWEKAVRIKEYNEKVKEKGLRDKDYIKNKILWVPFHEMDCDVDVATNYNEITRNPEAKVTKGNLYISLFGDGYAEVPVEDLSLKHRVFYIVSGHGGPDPGAQCIDCGATLCEDEYAYDVSLRLARNLMQHGATVHVVIQDQNDGIRDDEFLSCDKDEVCMGTLKIPLNQMKRLTQRSSEINKLYRAYLKKGIKDQTAIFIHVDSRSQGTKQDVFFYHHHTSKEGKNLAKKMQKTFKKKYDKFQKGRGYEGTVGDRNLFVLRTTQPTSVFVELANIRNTYDHKRLLQYKNRQALANWLFESLR